MRVSSPSRGIVAEGCADGGSQGASPLLGPSTIPIGGPCVSRDLRLSSEPFSAASLGSYKYEQTHWRETDDLSASPINFFVEKMEYSERGPNRKSSLSLQCSEVTSADWHLSISSQQPQEEANGGIMWQPQKRVDRSNWDYAGLHQQSPALISSSSSAAAMMMMMQRLSASSPATSDKSVDPLNIPRLPPVPSACDGPHAWKLARQHEGRPRIKHTSTSSSLSQQQQQRLGGARVAPEVSPGTFGGRYFGFWGKEGELLLKRGSRKAGASSWTQEDVGSRSDLCRSSSDNRRFTIPGHVSYVSAACFALMPPLAAEALAPLHVVLPITLSYGKVIVATQNPPFREHPLHHYYFKRQFPSASNMFSRLHGFCNQSPAWLALDLGYIACREHQVAPVVELFNDFFHQAVEELAEQEKASGAERACGAGGCMDPVRLRCAGVRLREDHGSGWFLYETPVEACSKKDSRNFARVTQLIERFNERVRVARLCQNATMKPFSGDKFAIVVLKQEGSAVSPEELQRVQDYCCEGIEISEVRLVRHKLLDKYGSAIFERDPRFADDDVFGRPLAHDKNGRHGRCVFAKAALPSVVVRQSHLIHPNIADLENDSEVSFGSDDDCNRDERLVLEGGP